jgi:hypothetical protein
VDSKIRRLGRFRWVSRLRRVISVSSAINASCVVSTMLVSAPSAGSSAASPPKVASGLP